MSFQPELAVVGGRIEGGDGLRVVQRLRQLADLLVVMTTTGSECHERIRCLEAGADEVVPRPAWPDEVAASVGSLLRSGGRSRQARVPLRVGSVGIDEASQRVIVRGRSTALTALELRLLAYFMRHRGEALDRATLLEHVWGFTIGDLSTVTVHVRRLREKIEADPAAPTLIRTVWGIGYCFDGDG